MYSILCLLPGVNKIHRQVAKCCHKKETNGKGWIDTIRIATCRVLHAH
jgi:hypothetical protein